MWKYGSVFLRHKFSNWKRSVSWRVIVLQHPIACNVPLDSLDPFSKSFQDIFVEGVINCLSWRYKFFVHNAMAVKKKQSWFSPWICSCVLSSDEENFSCAIPHFAVWSRDVVEHPWFISCYYFMQKIWLNFEYSQQILTNFQLVRFFAPQTSFSAPILHKFFTWANVLLELYEPHFYSSPFLLQSSWHSIGGLLLTPAHTTSTFWSFVDENGLPERGWSSTFSWPSLKVMCHLKTTVLDRVASP